MTNNCTNIINDVFEEIAINNTLELSKISENIDSNKEAIVYPSIEDIYDMDLNTLQYYKNKLLLENTEFTEQLLGFIEFEIKERNSINNIYNYFKNENIKDYVSYLDDKLISEFKTTNLNSTLTNINFNLEKTLLEEIDNHIDEKVEENKTLNINNNNSNCILNNKNYSNSSLPLIDIKNKIKKDKNLSSNILKKTIIENTEAFNNTNILNNCPTSIKSKSSNKYLNQNLPHLNNNISNINSKKDNRLEKATILSNKTNYINIESYRNGCKNNSLSYYNLNSKKKILDSQFKRNKASSSLGLKKTKNSLLDNGYTDNANIINKKIDDINNLANKSIKERLNSNSNVIKTNNDNGMIRTLNNTDINKSKIIYKVKNNSIKKNNSLDIIDNNNNNNNIKNNTIGYKLKFFNKKTSTTNAKSIVSLSQTSLERKKNYKVPNPNKNIIENNVIKLLPANNKKVVDNLIKNNVIIEDKISNSCFSIINSNSNTYHSVSESNLTLEITKMNSTFNIKNINKFDLEINLTNNFEIVSNKDFIIKTNQIHENSFSNKFNPILSSNIKHSGNCDNHNKENEEEEKDNFTFRIENSKIPQQVLNELDVKPSETIINNNIKNIKNFKIHKKYRLNYDSDSRQIIPNNNILNTSTRSINKNTEKTIDNIDNSFNKNTLNKSNNTNIINENINHSKSFYNNTTNTNNNQDDNKSNILKSRVFILNKETKKVNSTLNNFRKSNISNLNNNISNKELNKIKSKFNNNESKLFNNTTSNNFYKNINKSLPTLIPDLPNYLICFPTFKHLFNGFYLSNNIISNIKFDYLETMKDLCKSFNSLLEYENNNIISNKVNELSNTIVRSEGEVIKNRLKKLNDKLLLDQNDMSFDKMMMYKKILEMQKKDYCNKYIDTNNINNLNSNNKYYYRVVLSRPEVYDIVSYSMGIKAEWRELPHGLLLGNTWNVLWTYTYPKINQNKILGIQKVNHLIYNRTLARKDFLKKSIYRAKSISKKANSEFDIIPETYILGKEYMEFIDSFTKNANINPSSNIWIVKPSGKSRGKGIYLTNELSEVQPIDGHLVQKYINNPLLLDNKFKFDLRIYVLVTSVNPLEAFIYKEGFARVSNYEYTTSDLNNVIHLTNAAIQNKECKKKNNNNFEKEYGGSKISLEMLKNKIKNINLSSKYYKNNLSNRKNQCINWETIWEDIKQIVIKSLVASQFEMNYSPSNFELFGYDIIIDSNLECKLIEVNMSPSLERSNVLDDQIKLQLINDILNVLEVPSINHKGILEVLDRRIQMENRCNGEYSNTHYGQNYYKQLNSDLNIIFNFNYPRLYGQHPKDMGNFEILAPSKYCDYIIKIANNCEKDKYKIKENFIKYKNSII